MFTRRVLTLVAVAHVLAGAALAGPLAPPPPGPVAPTFKILTDIEPRIAVNATKTSVTSVTVYRISQPCSYYLAENLVGEAGKDGITIASTGVVLDLNGFELIGVAGSGDGVDANAGRVTIRSGAVTGWDEHGIYAVSREGVTIDSVKVASNVIDGNTLTRGTQGVLVNSTGNLIIRNGCSGNTLADYAIVAGNTAGPIIGVGNFIASNSPWENFSY